MGSKLGFEKTYAETNPPTTVTNQRRVANADRCTTLENSVFSKRESSNCVPKSTAIDNGKLKSILSPVLK